MPNDREQQVPPAARAELRRGVWLAVLLAAAGVLPFALVHLDDVDGAVYQVIARHVAEGGRLLPLRFLPDFWPRFFEHPPLYFWIQALVIRLGSEALLPWLGAACGIAAAAIGYWVGKELVGARAALLGAFLLAATEEFFRYQARPRLDPPLLLAYTASVAILLLARGRVRWLVAGGLCAGLGALVKGPPAFGAPVSAALALLLLGRRDELRRPRAWLATGAAMLLPPLIFLAVDGLVTGGEFWRGYVRDQFLASLTGVRTDGATSRLYLTGQLLARFWPGMPFLVWALVSAARNRRAPRSRAVLALGAWAAVVLVGYSAAGRALSSYILPSLVPLALAAGVGLEDVLQRLFGESGPRRALAVLVAVGAAGLVMVPFWPARWLVPPCPLGDLPAQAAALAPVGTRIQLSAAPTRSFTDLRANVGWLSQHAVRDVTVQEDSRARVGVFEVPIPGVPVGWTEVARHGAWVLARPPEQGGASAEPVR
jgi:4-amino-4-deoxy-L-arabinose transferase-like glycosyltransferase